MKLIIKQILAFVIDYLVILFYAAFLLYISSTIISTGDINNTFTYDPIKGQLIGFFSLTLPVFVYSFLSENSRWLATIGKKTQRLTVKTSSRNRLKHILLRNVLKYFPW